jgi:hypothetical protein
MNSLVAGPVRVWPRLLAVLAGALLTGCATERIDWPARIGNYSFDQAILEFGPPERTATLQDGSVVAEWLTARGSTWVHSGWGGWGYPSWYWYGPSPMYVSTSPDRYLRLTFDPNGKLVTWKRFSL